LQNLSNEETLCVFYYNEVLRIDSDFQLQTNCRWSCSDPAHWEPVPLD